MTHKAEFIYLFGLSHGECVLVIGHEKKTKIKTPVSNFARDYPVKCERDLDEMGL